LSRRPAATSEKEDRLPRVAKLRLTEDDARRLLLVRAIEAEDPAGTILTREDREHATAAALTQTGAAASGQASREAFLARRSRFALDRLAARYPAVVHAEQRARFPGWLGWTLPLAALLIGWASNEVFDGRRLNVISFPLFGMLAWNLVVYVLLIAGTWRALAPRRADRVPSGPIARLVGHAVSSLRGRTDAQPTLARGLRRFAADWLGHTASLNGARMRRAMHLAAAALAAGVVLGMYASGWDVEYRAGWESTWIRDPATLHALLSAVLGPASAVTGISLPSAAELPALQFGPGRPGVNAAAWIHLYAATALLFIIGPRLLLAGIEAARVARGCRRVRVPGTDDFYVRTLLRSVDGAGATVRIVPYSFNVPDETQQRLRRLLADVLGERTRVTIDPPIAYGGEDEWLAAARAGLRDDDYLVLLFNMSATPETENHGALVAGLQQRLASAGRGVVLAVLLDEAAMRRHHGGHAGARLETRREAWRAMLRPHGLEPVSIDLSDDKLASLAQALEAGLIRSSSEQAA
jgi:hypothetical protein